MDRTQRLVLGVFTSIAAVLLLLPWSTAEADSVLGPETMVEAPDFAGDSFKIESPRDGTYVHGSFVVELTIRDTEDGQVFDWSSNLGVDMVVVKGGPVVNVYTYDAATSGQGLHAPYNPNSEGWYDLSYIQFGIVDDQTTTTTVDQTTTTTVDPTTTTTVDQTTTTVDQTTTTTVDQTTTTVDQTTTTEGATSTTGREATSTTIPTEVLPTQVINTTVPAGVLPTEASTATTIATEVMAEGELPFTGLSGLRLTALGLALMGAGVTVILTQRQTEDIG